MTKMRSRVAAGHRATAHAAAEILDLGGTACDAALGGMLAACVAEPCLASLGGGGFLLYAPPNEAPRAYDFFCQTPGRKVHRPEAFRPILGDFGTTTQEFHIGAGSVATPGVVAGLLTIHRAESKLPLRAVVEPARRLAAEGVTVNSFQRYIMSILRPILDSTPAASQLFANTDGERAGEGDRLAFPGLADYLDALQRSDAQDWWNHELWQRVAKSIESTGGHVTSEDLANYRVARLDPLEISLGGARLFSNPPPAMGGALLAAGLLSCLDERGSVYARNTTVLLRAMDRMNRLRDNPARSLEGWGSALIGGWAGWAPELLATRGTTHLSVVDAGGGLAALTLSNGEGSGLVAPGGDFMLNNMLGEEDLQPAGFGRWPENRRLASMMAPSILAAADGTRLALGSGGSNRIRSALLQVIQALLGDGLSPEEAVRRARCHLEGSLLHYEPGAGPDDNSDVGPYARATHAFSDINLFFGGVHVAGIGPNGESIAAADPRRGGATATR